MHLRPYIKVLGPQREKVKDDVVKRHRNKESLRTIAREIGRSYGFVHQLLAEAGVKMRPRGGSRRRRS